MPRYKVKNQYTFFGKKPGELYLGGHILTLTKEEIKGQEHKVEEMPRDKKDGADPVAKSIDKPSENKMVTEPEVKKEAIPAQPAQTNAPEAKPKKKPRASTKNRVVARKD